MKAETWGYFLNKVQKKPLQKFFFPCLDLEICLFGDSCTLRMTSQCNFDHPFLKDRLVELRAFFSHDNPIIWHNYLIL